MPEFQAGPLHALDGVAPTIAPDAFIAPSAALIGDVTIGAQCGIWFHCVLRGDTNFIRIGARSNIQDGTIVHVNAGTFPTIIGEDVTVGHGCIIHACTLHDRAFVGMGATVLDGAVIEEGGMLAAGALLTPNKRIGRNEMWQGSPARLTRVMSDEERAKFDRTAVHYVELAQRYIKGLRAGG
ncbi:MAG: gamma carbonic anhydrase family protein [Rhodospirillales bacterium 70-18]|nr:gamma carbonic anhydrase family protein [Rhodospirillales bacterium]OJY73541.1 MAG: gamma carbonic anhydrase family protein [Rhodospirillales bacterium 70-18]